jgi:hypothetical protein
MITYRLVTPGMLLFCMAETTTGVKRWEDRTAPDPKRFPR